MPIYVLFHELAGLLEGLLGESLLESVSLLTLLGSPKTNGHNLGPQGPLWNPLHPEQLILFAFFSSHRKWYRSSFLKERIPTAPAGSQPELSAWGLHTKHEGPFLGCTIVNQDK